MIIMPLSIVQSHVLNKEDYNGLMKQSNTFNPHIKSHVEDQLKSLNSDTYVIFLERRMVVATSDPWLANACPEAETISVAPDLETKIEAVYQVLIVKNEKKDSVHIPSEVDLCVKEVGVMKTI
jgi:hypothetical protein